ncbi:MAG: M14 family metallopeptidase [bacterium]|nr:M14 family metallopeptidase [bacterium]
MKKGIVALIIIILIALGVWLLMKDGSDSTVTPDQELEDTDTSMGDENGDGDELADKTRTIIGSSVEGKEIVAYHYYGKNEDNVDFGPYLEILLVGGIHGGYSWNTALVAYEAIDYFKANPDAIPDDVKLTIVPVLNPDGLEAVVGTSGRFSKDDVPTSESETIPGRFNANEVDLNRNFDCDWQAEAKWQSRDVSGGTAAFSEPEAKAIRNYIEDVNPAAVVVYYSAAGGVFASNCHGGVLSETTDLTKVYADASGYGAYQSFDFYEISGDMVNWLAKEGVPAISVLLSDHQNVEWSKNRSGVEAILEYYSS